jgi:hypothetical protein
VILLRARYKYNKGIAKLIIAFSGFANAP